MRYTSISNLFGLDSYPKLLDWLVQGCNRLLSLDFSTLSLLTDSITSQVAADLSIRCLAGVSSLPSGLNLVLYVITRQLTERLLET